MNRKTARAFEVHLESAVKEAGFSGSGSDLLWRVVGGVAQGIFVVKTRYKGRYTVECAIAPAGGVRRDAPEMRKLLEESSLKFPLSPVAPFRNSYDWTISDEQNGKAAGEEVAGLLRLYALPVFEYVSSVERLPIATGDAQTDQEIELCGRLAEPLLSMGYHSAEDGRFLWKRNGDIFVIVLPSILGFGAFLAIYLVLWSPKLDGEQNLVAEPPGDFSRVAFVELSDSGIVDEAPGELWTIGNSAGRDRALAQIAQVIGDSAEGWLRNHRDLASLIRVVDPQLRSSVQRVLGVP